MSALLRETVRSPDLYLGCRLARRWLDDTGGYAAAASVARAVEDAIPPARRRMRHRGASAQHFTV